MPHQPDNPKRDASRLMASMGEPAVGRREAPQPEDPGASRRRVVVGVALGAVVVAAVLALMLFLAPSAAAAC
ncbi:hypothetical protein [Adlercreutzia faecimuris]|uniref:Uncharacterized protein n=1 Tax=Adlercreutzia faecimuris TaxID=2897341 RepID=A0ABS9WIP5_9ACTN|nr:hypothetical protein [Adlercreutzia sp. JBNU-10]MCI2242748.1 hypothetical protein [Adlercreutzia sp. JBNU-10]